jgi:hypothetical protein
VHAQATRAEELRQAREKKQESLSPYEPGRFERGLKFVETRGVPLITRDGIYLKFGSLTTGSGFAYGAGFRTRGLFDRTGLLDIWGGVTAKGYRAAEGRLRFPGLADQHLMVDAYTRWHDYPKEDYFGLGPGSLRSSQTDFSLRATTVGGRVGVRPVPVVTAGGGIEYLAPRIGNGSDEALPSISERFDAATAPGLFQQPNFVRSIAFVDVDWRRPLNARNGGWYRFELSRFAARGSAESSFNRFDMDLRQFVGYLAERRVLFLRLLASTSDVGTSQTMPFYLMPTLGGNDSLRGFRDYRFRGPHALLAQGEYRFEIWSGLDGALFYDAGKVAMHRPDLNFRNLESNYGFGFRFNTNEGVVVRVDSAFGSRDGKHLWIAFGGSF